MCQKQGMKLDFGTPSSFLDLFLIPDFEWFI